ncbi:hypothetical protein BWQ96_06261 [Gracilariopsis chorda]|uniref:Uncharacterized protein n=1 Tax=Gracilariopsis chorda TaxID=448386 RepID=A0A2V3IPH0_9FLOR|nr:hypothetical protein BWQ96_06261 [Gracilariopsis chorda]|eukprot:PXF43985.1 hypothetical protein BWQ96_06261 [Gracilariopsis chorda]
MEILGYVCHHDNKCRYDKGKLVSRETAMLHLAAAHDQIEKHGRDESIFLPLPCAITSYSQLSFLYAQGIVVVEDDIQNAHEYSPESTQSISTESVLLSTGSESERSSCVIQESEHLIDHVHITCSEVFSDTIGGIRQFMCLDRKFALFMENYSNVLGLGIKHFADDAFMTDFSKDILGSDRLERRYKSFSGVRNALVRNSGLHTTELPACPKFHKALEMKSDGSFVRFSCCTDDPNDAADLFEYIPVWERIEMLLQSPIEGSLLFNYM